MNYHNNLKIRTVNKILNIIIKTAPYAILISLLLLSTIFISCNKDVGTKTTQTAATSAEQEAAVEVEVQTSETSAETIEESNYYVSTSDEFTNYSFLCPRDWKLFDTDGGKRVVLENSKNSESDIESIFITVIDKDNLDGLDSEENIFKAYSILSLSSSVPLQLFEDEHIKIDNQDVRLSGYEYNTSLNTGGKDSVDSSSSENNDELDCVDYLTVLEKENNFYCIKYIGLNKNNEKAKSTFVEFLNTFKIASENEGELKQDDNSKVNILILGDDSGMGRAGGRVNGRTDIIILLHLNLETCKGTAVTIPRDTWVNIPGYGEGKINGAHAVGGNELTVKVIEELSGLEIDNYIITDFDGFIPLIDFLGGVTVEVGEDLNDDFSGCYLTKGVHHLDGTQALALARNRHRAGDGSTQSGAFAREREAAKIIVGLLEQKSTFDRVIAMPLFINYILNHTWTDLTFQDIIKYLPVLGKIKANDIELTGIPSWPQAVGNASAVVYDVEATAELFEEIKDQ